MVFRDREYLRESMHRQFVAAWRLWLDGRDDDAERTMAHAAGLAELVAECDQVIPWDGVPS